MENDHPDVPQWLLDLFHGNDEAPEPEPEAQGPRPRCYGVLHRTALGPGVGLCENCRSLVKLDSEYIVEVAGGLYCGLPPKR